MIFTETDASKDKIMLMIHGWPDTKILWKDYIEKYRGEYNVLTVNLPLFSKDELESDQKIAYTKDAIEQKLLYQLNQYTGKEITILAHDWGAVIAIDFVQSHPNIVDKLITLDIGYMKISPIVIAKYLALYQGALLLSYFSYHTLMLNKFDIHYEKWNTFPRNVYLYIPLVYGKYNLEYRANTTKRLFIYGKNKLFDFHEEENNVTMYSVDGGHWDFFENETNRNRTFDYIDDFLKPTTAEG
jgi:pimeloyl-ACP methyl ester carboxylesterase